MLYFYVYQDERQQWRWRFTSSNGEIIAIGSESYHNFGDCEHAIDLLKKNASNAVILGDVTYKKNRP